MYDATGAYYAVLLVQQQIKVAENALKLAETLLRDVETKRKFGVASDFNVLRSQVEVSNARAQAIVFRNRLHSATADLFRTLGVAQDSGVVLTETLDYRPETADERAAYERALRDRPELRNADLTVKLREQSVQVARSEFFPKIEAFLGETYAKPDPLVSGLNDWGDSWRAGVTVRFNVFDGGKNRGRLIQERAAFRQAEIDLLDAKENVRLDVTKAVSSLQDAAEAVDVQKQTREQAAEGLRLAEVGYREGTLDQVQVLEARAALTQAQLYYFTSLYSHAVARLDLARAQGALTPPGPVVAPGVGGR